MCLAWQMGRIAKMSRCRRRSVPYARAVFGEVDDCTLTCTLHGWRFDLETGRCLTADDRALRVRRRESTIPES